jgi:hypothetical protein
MKSTISLFFSLSGLQSRLGENYKLQEMKNKLAEGLTLTNNPMLSKYITNILDLTYADLAKLYLNLDGSLKALFDEKLPNGFDNLGQYKSMPGIYFFLATGGKSYLGSTSNLWRRIFKEHKVRPFNDKSRVHHPLFYNFVFKQSWDDFRLLVLALVPNHLAAFLLQIPGQTMTSQEQELLELLTLYHTTFVEQFFMDLINPALNTEKLANASSPNLGATGMVRSPEFRETVSIAHLGRTYNQATLDLHRVNMQGTILSDETRAKMSDSYGGVSTYVMDQVTLEVSSYSTKSDAATALGISIRTLSRWAENPTRFNAVKNNTKFTKVRVSFSKFQSM